MSACSCALAGTQACIACPNHLTENPFLNFKFVQTTLIKVEKEDAE